MRYSVYVEEKGNERNLRSAADLAAVRPGTCEWQAKAYCAGFFKMWFHTAALAGSGMAGALEKGPVVCTAVQTAGSVAPCVPSNARNELSERTSASMAAPARYGVLLCKGRGWGRYKLEKIGVGEALIESPGKE